MKRWPWVVVGVAALGSAAVAFVALGRRPELTTSSPAAAAEFQAGRDASMKLYAAEAEQHFEKAVALDPEFVLAKLLLAEHLYGSPERLERRKRLLEEVAAADLSRLTPRERFLVQRNAAMRAGKADEARKLTADYLAERPDDPWGLNLAAADAWSRGDMAESERLNRRLIEVSPNWVIAYNMLGYSAMDQGKFAEAEENFISYRFIAPDQANPHDSLGELFLLIGRYDEAIATLEQAIRIRPDFWASYEHLFVVHMVRGDWVAAQAVVDRATAAKAPAKLVADLGCALRLARLADERAWNGLLDEAARSCPKLEESGDYVLRVTHLALCELGRFDDAKAIEEGLRRAIEKKVAAVKDEENMVAPSALLAHLEGVRLALAGDLVGAAERLGRSDAAMTYRNAPQGLLKLVNRLALVELYRAQGNEPEAARLENEVRAVNAPLATAFEASGRRLLGLPHG